MMYYTSKRAEVEFERNLRDWHKGGPKPGGWTRAGAEIPYRAARLLGCCLGMVDVDEALAKNRAETERWHIGFLKGDESPYWWEYLMPRYNEAVAAVRAEAFRELFKSIKERGVMEPVWIAEADWLGIRHFRFNGCHRLCSAKVLGIKEVPALIFKTKVL